MMFRLGRRVENSPVQVLHLTDHLHQLGTLTDRFLGTISVLSEVVVRQVWGLAVYCLTR
jgi:hypothetical protein